MLKALLRVLARGLVDLGLVCFIVAGLLLYTSFRVLRRLYTEDPSELERNALTLLAAIGTAAGAAARYKKSAPPSAPPRV